MVAEHGCRVNLIPAADTARVSGASSDHAGSTAGRSSGPIAKGRPKGVAEEEAQPKEEQRSKDKRRKEVD